MLAKEWIEHHKTLDTDECMLWPFFKDHNGRARAIIDKQSIHVAAVMCEALHGPKPSPKHRAVVTCANRENGCCNPRHTEWKTASEFMKEKWAKGIKRRFTGNRPMLSQMEIDRLKYLRYEQRMSYHAIKLATGVNKHTSAYWTSQRNKLVLPDGRINKFREAGIMSTLDKKRFGIIKPRVFKRDLIRVTRPANLLAYPYIRTAITDHHEMILRVNSIVPHGIAYREDICQEIIADYLLGILSLDNITPTIINAYKRKVSKANFEQSGYALSLDLPMPNGQSWHDVLTA